jgi:hypothetical protein
MARPERGSGVYRHRRRKRGLYGSDETDRKPSGLSGTLVVHPRLCYHRTSRRSQ